MGNTSFANSNNSNMNFITIIAFANVCLAFDITLNAEGKDRTLCCADAKRQCSDKCSSQLCTETCEARCGLFNTNCGSWTCQDIAGFSCITTTTQAAVTAAACKAVGEVCLTTTGTITACCTATDTDNKCTDISAITTEGVKCVA